jgi:hypothetical protein
VRLPSAPVPRRISRSPISAPLDRCPTTLGEVAEKGSPEGDPVRTAELIAAACLATDLGMGFPFEHGLHGTLMAMKLADLLDVDPPTASQTYYASLLMYSGCTTDADVATRIFAGSRTERVTPVQFGSTSQVVAGVIRALPAPGAPPHARMYQAARRFGPATLGPTYGRTKGGPAVGCCIKREIVAVFSLYCVRSKTMARAKTEQARMKCIAGPPLM